MAWDDLQDPSLFTPRDTPRVQRAASPQTAAPQEPLQEPDYLFDEPEAWDDALEALPTQRQRQTRPLSDMADIPPENPYARRRNSDNGAPAGDGTIVARGNPILYATVIAVCLAILAALCVMMMPQMAGYFWKDLDNVAFVNGEMLRYDQTLVKNYKQYRDYLKQDIIYQGIFVDGEHVGGLSVADAKAKLTADGAGQSSPFSVNISIGNKSWTLSNENISSERNLDHVLARAYAIGRSNTTATIGTSLTPFRERVNTVMGLMQQYVSLRSDATFDHDAVRARIQEIAAYVTRDPVDSIIESFDPNTRSFTFTDEQPGVTIDSEALYQQVIAKIDQGAVNETINVTAQITTPSVTKSDLMNNFKLVSAYTTETTSAKNRNNNISLACQAINGKVLLPGETFSFNETTGKRTTDKGYQSAGAIAAGQSIEEVGGGICQVSSTLFNAVARADLEIVSRSPHAWPSTYVKIGEDATVNWPNLDFQFRNNKSTPVFIIAYYKDRKCSAEIWGMSLGTGITIDLDSKVLRTIEPNTEVLYKQNPELTPGTSEETVHMRTGYVVDTYKVWYKDGQEIKRERLHTSTYKAYQTTIEYN
ncbi:MAG: VanW family protein [Candidatus Limiplasma sp.]|nr:VanW family protein [Candidatus Limiplasma sp.]